MGTTKRASRNWGEKTNPIQFKKWTRGISQDNTQPLSGEKFASPRELLIYQTPEIWQKSRGEVMERDTLTTCLEVGVCSVPATETPRPCDWTPITCSSCIGLLMDCLPGTTRGSPSNVLSDMFFFPSYIGMVVGMRKSNDLISRWCIIVSGVRPWSNQSRTSSWLVLSWDACLKLKWLIRKNQPHGAAILRRS